MCSAQVRRIAARLSWLCAQHSHIAQSQQLRLGVNSLSWNNFGAPRAASTDWQQASILQFGVGQAQRRSDARTSVVQHALMTATRNLTGGCSWEASSNLARTCTRRCCDTIGCLAACIHTLQHKPKRQTSKLAVIQTSGRVTGCMRGEAIVAPALSPWRQRRRSCHGQVWPGSEQACPPSAIPCRASRRLRSWACEVPVLQASHAQQQNAAAAHHVPAQLAGAAAQGSVRQREAAEDLHSATNTSQVPDCCTNDAGLATYDADNFETTGHRHCCG